MRTGHWFVLVLAICMVLGTVGAASADYDDPETWFVGAQFGYWTADPILGSIYEEHGTLNGTPFGLQGGYKWDMSKLANVEVVGLANYWVMNMSDLDDGDYYLVKNGDPEDRTDILVDSFNMFSMGANARFALKVHKIVQPIFNLGLELGFPSGSIEKRDYGADAAGNAVPDKWEDASLPSVVPIVNLGAGLRIAIPDNVCIDLELLTFKTGLYVGMSILYFN